MMRKDESLRFLFALVSTSPTTKKDVHLFGCLPSRQTFLDYQSWMPEKSDFREIIVDTTPARLHFDMEWEGGEQAEELPKVYNVLEAVREALLAKFGYDLDPSKWVVACGSRESKGRWKASYHVVHTALAFQSNHTGMKRFVQLGLPPEVTGGVVDTGIYTKRRQFRVVGAAKASDPTRTPMAIITPGHAPLDALISVAAGEGAGVDRIITDEETEAAFGPAPPKKIAGKPRQALAAPAVEASSLQALLATVLGDTTTQIAATATAGEYYGKTVGTRTCPTGETHTSNNCYLTVDADSRVWYRCLGAQCAGEPACIGVLNDKKGNDDDDESSCGLDLSRVEAYLYNEVRHLPLGRDDTPRVTLSRSPMGSGKTVQVNRLLAPRPAKTLMDVVQVERVRRREAFRRVLVISPRVQFSVMAASTFYGGFSLYLNRKNLRDDYLVCQYESLHKLMAEGVEPYDLIIIDGYESVLDCMVCFATNGGNMLANAQVFQAFVRRAGTRVIALDADLSQRGVDTIVALLAGADAAWQGYNPDIRVMVNRHTRQAAWMHLGFSQALLGDLWGEQISRAPNPPYVFDGMLITKLTDDTQSSRASSPKIDDQDKKN
jgi:hypothetical protein